MTKNPILDARELVTELYPHALWAVLAGSRLAAARAAGSDLDIVVLLPQGDPRAPQRDSRRYRGWPVELFVHDERSLARDLTTEFAARKPQLHRMVGTGFALVGTPHDWRDRCAKVLAGGPLPLSPLDSDGLNEPGERPEGRGAFARRWRVCRTRPVPRRRRDSGPRSWPLSRQARCRQAPDVVERAQPDPARGDGPVHGGHQRHGGTVARLCTVDDPDVMPLGIGNRGRCARRAVPLVVDAQPVGLVHRVA
ncbi:nucleotidyltransferase domain-containing protein [Allorhizocola rhizosphaerae]|uniref:nucleotidyltransferase domain-containing protein n=1 Tax=Allorhizocola rhizosphaerae TaxID=1872709 RepID=UPI000E3EE075|nr:nucleotidyltransferase domain-containing protein [Allorhizocola rhizosphaerae]